MKSSISVACALVSIINLDKKFSTDIIKSLIFPCKSGQPIYNLHGFYGVKLIVNGCYREFLIDDNLPCVGWDHILTRSVK